MKEVTTLYTTVKPDLYKRALLKGTLMGALSVLLLAFAGLFIPLSALESIGPILGLISLVLMGFGFKPFLTLKRIETSPVPLKLSNDSVEWKNLILSIKDIQEISYIDREKKYGIEIHLKEGQKYFLPYYSKRYYEEFLAFLDNRFDFE
ncbi:MAG: hypothetical protein ACK4HV_02425 [Parachlamydiaceae bacterium]